MRNFLVAVLFMLSVQLVGFSQDYLVSIDSNFRFQPGTSVELEIYKKSKRDSTFLSKVPASKFEVACDGAVYKKGRLYLPVSYSPGANDSIRLEIVRKRGKKRKPFVKVIPVKYHGEITFDYRVTSPSKIRVQYPFGVEQHGANGPDLRVRLDQLFDERILKIEIKNLNTNVKHYALIDVQACRLRIDVRGEDGMSSSVNTRAPGDGGNGGNVIVSYPPEFRRFLDLIEVLNQGGKGGQAYQPDTDCQQNRVSAYNKNGAEGRDGVVSFEFKE